MLLDLRDLYLPQEYTCIINASESYNTALLQVGISQNSIINATEASDLSFVLVNLSQNSIINAIEFYDQAFIPVNLSQDSIINATEFRDLASIITNLSQNAVINAIEFYNQAFIPVNLSQNTVINATENYDTALIVVDDTASTNDCTINATSGSDTANIQVQVPNPIGVLNDSGWEERRRIRLEKDYYDLIQLEPLKTIHVGNDNEQKVFNFDTYLDRKIKEQKESVKTPMLKVRGVEEQYSNDTKKVLIFLGAALIVYLLVKKSNGT